MATPYPGIPSVPSRRKAPKRKRRWLWSLVAGVLTIGGGGGGGIYFLLSRKILTAPHSGAVNVVVVTALILLALIFVVVLAVLVAWLRLFWRAGNRSIDTIESHLEAREMLQMLGTMLQQLVHPARDHRNSLDEPKRGAAAEAQSDRDELVTRLAPRPAAAPAAKSACSDAQRVAANM